MLIGRRNKENAAGAVNSSAMELQPGRKSSGTKLPETPQKLKAEILQQNRVIEQLRRLLDQANKGGGGSDLPSPRQKLFACDCAERHRTAIKKIEACIELIRQNSWGDAVKVAIAQDALDLLQAGLALFFAPAQTKARVSRRHSMTSSISTDDLSEDSYKTGQVINVEQKIAEYQAKLSAALKHEQEVEAVVVRLGEACRLSESTASEYRTKCETLQSSLMTERKSAASLVLRVQEADRERLQLREEVIRLEGELEILQVKRNQSQRVCEQANEVLVENKILVQKVDRLSRDISREKEFSEVQAYTIERLEKENSNLTKAVSERDERIRSLVCHNFKTKEAERDALLNRISIANTAVSTLQLELQLKQNHEDDEESDEEGASDESPYSDTTASLQLKKPSKERHRQVFPIFPRNTGCIVGVDPKPSHPAGIPLFLLSSQLFPSHNSVRLIKKCLSPSCSTSEQV